jgi:hypothetical protein
MGEHNSGSGLGLPLTGRKYHSLPVEEFTADEATGCNGAALFTLTTNLTTHKWPIINNTSFVSPCMDSFPLVQRRISSRCVRNPIRRP